MLINSWNEQIPVQLSLQGPGIQAPAGQEGEGTMGLLGKVVAAKKVGERRDEKKEAKKEAEKKEEEKK
ncbi:MAG: hypothetical protein LUO96_00725 [Methanomicrobiales archaeon]|nr:hypothetical protein [Methanomicrobiales archaeon]